MMLTNQHSPLREIMIAFFLLLAIASATLTGLSTVSVTITSALCTFPSSTIETATLQVTPVSFTISHLECTSGRNGFSICGIATPAITIDAATGDCFGTICSPVTVTSTTSLSFPEVSEAPLYSIPSLTLPVVTVGQYSSLESISSPVSLHSTSTIATYTNPTSPSSTSSLPISSTQTGASSKTVKVPRIFSLVGVLMNLFESTLAVDFINLKPYRVPNSTTTSKNIESSTRTISFKATISPHFTAVSTSALGFSAAHATISKASTVYSSTSHSTAPSKAADNDVPGIEDAEYTIISASSPEGTYITTSMVTSTRADVTSIHVEVSTHFNPRPSSPSATKNSASLRSFTPPRVFTVLTTLLKFFTSGEACSIKTISTVQVPQVTALAEDGATTGPPLPPAYFPPKSYSSGSKSRISPRVFILISSLMNLCSASTVTGFGNATAATWYFFGNISAATWYIPADPNITHSVPSLAGFLPTDPHGHSYVQPQPTSRANISIRLISGLGALLVLLGIIVFL